MMLHNIQVKGFLVDSEMRCKHYSSEKDIIAIKFACCNTYYPCYECHQEAADHQAQVWKVQQFDEKAILCGVCGSELTINEYMSCNSICPTCHSNYNPGCKLHYPLYFEIL